MFHNYPSEFFDLFSKSVINQDLGLFLSTGSLLRINPNSGIQEGHLYYFHFIGRIIGYSMFQRQVMNFRFIPAYYKLLLGRPLDYRDLQTFDNEIFNSIEKVATQDVTDWGLTFSLDVEDFGVTNTIELVKGGGDIEVDEENKHEYMRYFVLNIQDFDRVLPLQTRQASI